MCDDISDSDDFGLICIITAVVVILAGSLFLAFNVSSNPDAQMALRQSVEHANHFDFFGSMAYFQEMIQIVLQPDYLETATCFYYQDAGISHPIMVDTPYSVYPDVEYATYHACVFPNGTVLKDEFLGNFTPRDATRRFFFL